MDRQGDATPPPERPKPPKTAQHTRSHSPLAKNDTAISRRTPDELAARVSDLEKKQQTVRRGFAAVEQTRPLDRWLAVEERAQKLEESGSTGLGVAVQRMGLAMERWGVTKWKKKDYAVAAGLVLGTGAMTLIEGKMTADFLADIPNRINAVTAAATTLSDIDPSKLIPSVSITNGIRPPDISAAFAQHQQHIAQAQELLTNHLAKTGEHAVKTVGWALGTTATALGNPVGKIKAASHRFLGPAIRSSGQAMKSLAKE